MFFIGLGIGIILILLGIYMMSRENRDAIIPLSIGFALLVVCAMFLVLGWSGLAK